MKDIEFPIFKTKMGQEKTFDLSSPTDREKYFQLKAGEEIEKLQNYLQENTFIIYLLGKKSAGKGTYSKMLAEIIAPEKIEHFSIGDMIRGIDKELESREGEKEIARYLEENYRGWRPIEQIIESLKDRSTKTLLPTDLILSLVRREISKREKKTLFIDGFPRDMDQISYSLFFRDLIGYREDADFFALIDVPEQVIDERIKWRRICPRCNTSRNLRLLPSSYVEYDEEKKEFYLLCDNPACEKVRMIRKEGDEAGIDPIRERLEMDEKLIKQAFDLYGVPKILLRNCVPVDKAEEYVDFYELTTAYNYHWDVENKKVKVTESPWLIKDEKGVESYSLLAPPVVVSFVKQLVDLLHI